ncbi:DUF3810 domain-containing protein [Algoriphagus namhaensis]
MTERLYSNGIFPWIRNTIDYTLGKLPFPSVYFFMLSVLGVLVFYFFQLRKKKGFPQKMAYSIQAVCNGAGALVFFFLFLWGFNYQRVSLPESLGLQLRPLELEEVREDLLITQDAATELRKRLRSDTTAIVELMDYEQLESQVRKALEEQIQRLDLQFWGRPRTKLFPPEGMMRRLGVLGIYWPFTGESYIDPSLHPLERPFTIAHEMAHSLGVTNEGEANFVAWVVGTHSNLDRLNYSAQLRLMIYQMREYARMDPDGYRIWVPSLDRGIVNDILSIREYADRYPPISLDFSRASNDIFLKTQGVKEGVKSYQQMPMLVHAWRKRSLN